MIKGTFAAIVRTYHWSKAHLQSFGYGMILIGLSRFGFGDFLMLILGIVACIGGLQAIWHYVMDDDSDNI